MRRSRAERERLARAAAGARRDGCRRGAACANWRAIIAAWRGDIRAGRFDGEERAALLEHLRRTTEAKLAVSNPKMLQANRLSRITSTMSQEP